MNEVIKQIEDKILLAEAKYINTNNYNYILYVNKLKEVIETLETLEDIK